VHVKFTENVIETARELFITKFKKERVAAVRETHYYYKEIILRDGSHRRHDSKHSMFVPDNSEL